MWYISPCIPLYSKNSNVFHAFINQLTTFFAASNFLVFYINLTLKIFTYDSKYPYAMTVLSALGSCCRRAKIHSSHQARKQNIFENQFVCIFSKIKVPVQQKTYGVQS